MRSRRFGNGYLGAKLLAGSVIALSAVAASVTPALASPAVQSHVSARAETLSSAAETSIFIAYSGRNQTGKVTNINGCGGHNMPYAVGSYAWVARGQSAFLYNSANEGGTITGRLGAGTNANSNSPVGWKSILIIC
jgi:hypothetical protein